MSTTHPTHPQAEPAANGPARDWAARCAPDPAPERIERHRTVLEELTEMTMAVGRTTVRTAAAEAAIAEKAAAAAEASATPPVITPSRAALAMTRIAHSVRMTLMLETKFDEDYRARLLREQAGQPVLPGAATSPAAAAADRQAQNEAAAQHQRRKRNKAKARRIIAEVIERGEHDERPERLHGMLEDRFDQNDEYADLGDLPPGAIAAHIARDLGMTPNWRQWATEDWAADAVATKVRAWPGDPDRDEEKADAERAEDGPLQPSATVPWRSGDG